MFQNGLWFLGKLWLEFKLQPYICRRKGATLWTDSDCGCVSVQPLREEL